MVDHQWLSSVILNLLGEFRNNHVHETCQVRNHVETQYMHVQFSGLRKRERNHFMSGSLAEQQVGKAECGPVFWVRLMILCCMFWDGDEQGLRCRLKSRFWEVVRRNFSISFGFWRNRPYVHPGKKDSAPPSKLTCDRHQSKKKNHSNQKQRSLLRKKLRSLAPFLRTRRRLTGGTCVSACREERTKTLNKFGLPS